MKVIAFLHHISSNVPYYVPVQSRELAPDVLAFALLLGQIIL